MEILKEKNIYNQNSLNSDTFHIVFGIDDDFIRPLGILMTSIILNNPKEKIAFHIITKFINKQHQQQLENFSKKNNVYLSIYTINKQYFYNMPTTSYISQAMYNRFLIPFLLKNITDKALYLDADIICLNSLKKLKSIDINNNIIAAVNESNPSVVKSQTIKLNLKSKRYFNSGMLYININNWIKNSINDKLIKAVQKYTDLSFPDQDLLNIVLENDCIYIDKKYNYTFDVRYKSNRYIYTIPDDTVFLHYVGRFKPWQEWCMHPLREKFRTIAKQSLWKDIPWDKPKTYKQMKNMAKSYWIYNKKFKSILWYLKYSIYKLKSKL